MVVVAGGVIPTQDHNFILGRGDNDSDEESRCCNAIFVTGTHITNAAIEVLRLIRDMRGGWRQLFAYDIGPPPRTLPRP